MRGARTRGAHSRRTGRWPKDYLVDAAYTDKASVDALATLEVTLYGAVPARNGNDPFTARRIDGQTGVRQDLLRSKTMH